MWLAVTASVASACSMTGEGFSGFDRWVYGAVEVPTDARIVVFAAHAPTLVLTRLDNQEVVETSGEYTLHVLGGVGRVAFTPASELAPGTSYRADVIEPEGVVGSATFTTGDGPTPAGIASPELEDLDGEPWEDSSLFICSIGHPVVARTLTARVRSPELPVGSYVALRSESRDAEFDRVSPGFSGVVELDVLQGEHSSRSEEARERRDCLTPVVVLPSGAEVEGDEICMGRGLGCASGGTAGLGLAPIGLLTLLVPRRRRGPRAATS